MFDVSSDIDPEYAFTRHLRRAWSAHCAIARVRRSRSARASPGAAAIGLLAASVHSADQPIAFGTTCCARGRTSPRQWRRPSNGAPAMHPAIVRSTRSIPVLRGLAAGCAMGSTSPLPWCVESVNGVGETCRGSVSQRRDEVPCVSFDTLSSAIMAKSRPLEEQAMVILRCPSNPSQTVPLGRTSPTSACSGTSP